MFDTITARHNTDEGAKNYEEYAARHFAVGLAVRSNDLAVSSDLHHFITRDHILHKWRPKVMITASRSRLIMIANMCRKVNNDPIAREKCTLKLRG